jgi:hypothetical protein
MPVEWPPGCLATNAGYRIRSSRYLPFSRPQPRFVEMVFSALQHLSRQAHLVTMVVVARAAARHGLPVTVIPAADQGIRNRLNSLI